jgi:hypothetical protein
MIERYGYVPDSGGAGKFRGSPANAAAELDQLAPALISACAASGRRSWTTSEWPALNN